MDMNKNNLSYENETKGLTRRDFVKWAGAGLIASSLVYRDASANIPPIPGLSTGFRGPLVDRWIDSRCLEHNSINMAWARECTVLPCFKGVAWPQYAEQIIMAEISGPMTPATGKKYPIIIHNWKGLCPKFKWDPSFPGGYGAEVGIYRWLSPQQVQNKENERYSKQSMWTRNSLNIAAGIRPNERWYPAPELQAKISFKLLDPENNNRVVIDTDERRRYISPNTRSKYITTHPYQDPADRYFWCTDWLSRESYERWAKARPQYKGGPGFIDGVQLTLAWELRGMHGDVVRGTWEYHPDDHVCAPFPLYGCSRNNKIPSMRKQNPSIIDAPWPDHPMLELNPSKQPQRPGVGLPEDGMKERRLECAVHPERC